jgi:hypothetical protein
MRCWANAGRDDEPSGSEWPSGARVLRILSTAEPRDPPRGSSGRCPRTGSRGVGTRAAAGIRSHGRCGPHGGSTRRPRPRASHPVPRPVPRARRAAGVGTRGGRRRHVPAPRGRRGGTAGRRSAGARRGRSGSRSPAQDVGGLPNGNPGHHDRVTTTGTSDRAAARPATWGCPSGIGRTPHGRLRTACCSGPGPGSYARHCWPC